MRLSIRVAAIKYYLLTLTRKTPVAQVPDSMHAFPIWSSRSSAVAFPSLGARCFALLDVTFGHSDHLHPQAVFVFYLEMENACVYFVA